MGTVSAAPVDQRTLVTGASGFVGGAVVAELHRRGILVTAASRRPTLVPVGVRVVSGGELGAGTEWREELACCATVVHLAARVHVMRDTAQDPLAEFRRVNVDATLALARQAATAGVRRFIFLSTVKVNGEATSPGRPYRETDRPAPEDPYAQSKMEAEQGLRELTRSTAMAVTIIRLPLVYGPGVRANVRTLINAVRRGIPLPLGAIDNRRSLIGLGNLTDFIVHCLDHPKAAGETFFVSDGEDLSTPELVRRLARAMDRRSRVIPVPVPLLSIGAAWLGKRDMLHRLTGSLQVDITKARTLLDWSPPCTVDEELRRTVALVGVR